MEPEWISWLDRHLHVQNRMIHEEITQEIIGAAMAVLNELKPGLDEKLYENALVLELETRGHPSEQQRRYPFIIEDILSASSFQI